MANQAARDALVASGRSLAGDLWQAVHSNGSWNDLAVFVPVTATLSSYSCQPVVLELAGGHLSGLFSGCARGGDWAPVLGAGCARGGEVLLLLGIPALGAGRRELARRCSVLVPASDSEVITTAASDSEG